MPGLEGYGIVVEVGAGVSKVKVGNRVVPFFDTYNGKGSWQEFVVLSQDDVAIVPDSVDDASAAQLVVNPFTVIGLLDELKVPPGEFLLQTAAGSVLGRQLIQVAKHRGIKTVNVVRRAAQIDELKALGADVVVSTEGLSGAAAIAEAIVKAIGGKHAYAAVEAVSGELTAATTAAVRRRGVVLLYGLMDGVTTHADGPSLLFRGVTLKGFWLADVIHDKQKRAQLATETFDLISKKVLVPFSGSILPLESASDAVKKSNEKARGGKILLSS